MVLRVIFAALLLPGCGSFEGQREHPFPDVQKACEARGSDRSGAWKVSFTPTVWATSSIASDGEQLVHAEECVEGVPCSVFEFDADRREWSAIEATGTMDAMQGWLVASPQYLFYVNGRRLSGDTNAVFVLDREQLVWEEVGLPQEFSGRRMDAFWTGERLLLWGGNVEGSAQADGVFFDPESRSWETLETLDKPPAGWSYPVWTGSELAVWFPGEGMAIRDPRATEWRFESEGDMPPASLQTVEVASVGGLVFLWSSDREMWRFDPADGSWLQLDVPPWAHLAYGLAVAGKLVFSEAWVCPFPALYDPVNDSWELLPAEGGPVTSDGVRYAAGDRFFVYGLYFGEMEITDLLQLDIIDE